MFAWPNQKGTRARKSIQFFFFNFFFLFLFLPHLDFPANQTHGQLWADKKPLWFKKNKSVLRGKNVCFNADLLIQQQSYKRKRAKNHWNFSPCFKTRGGWRSLVETFSLEFAGAMWPSEEQICSGHRYTGGFSWIPQNQRWFRSSSFLPLTLCREKLSLRISSSDVKLLLTWYWAKAEVELSLPKNGEKGYAVWEQSKSPVD